MVPLFRPTYSLAVSSLVLLILTISAVAIAFPGGQAVSSTPSPRPRDFTVTPVPNQLVIQPGAVASSNLILTSIGGFTGIVSLSATISRSNGTAPTGTVTPSSVRLRSGVNASSILQVSTTTATAIGTYTVTIIAQAPRITHTTFVTVLVALPGDFQFVLEPNSETVALGSSRTSFYGIASINGFAGTVDLVPSNIPVNVGVGTSQVTVLPGGNVTGNIFINVGSTAAPGTYSIPFTATSGSLSHTATLKLTISAAAVPDFSITTNLLFLTIPEGSVGFVNITVSSIGSFAGSVSITGSVIPAISSGPVAVVSPSSIFVSPNATGSALLSLITNTTTPTGFYNYTVTGTSGSLFHQVVGSFTVTISSTADFTLSATPSSLTIPQGSQDRDFLNITSINGFSGTVSLTATVSPLGPFLVLASNQVTLAPGGTTTLVLAVFTNTTIPVPFGNYSITVTGSSTGNTHTIVIPLTVTVPAENLFLLSATFQPTNVTLQVHNTGNMAASLVIYYAQDKAGNTWSRTSWAGPTIGPNSTSTVFLTIGVSCPACTYSGTPGAFNQFTPGNVYTISLVSARNNLYRFSVSYPSGTREALALEAYTFTSGTNLTLFIRNFGNVSVSLVSYYVKDSSGNQYALTTWAGPTINPNSTSPAMILIGSSCASCTIVGSAFTFNPGFSYTIVIVTSRNNQFSFTVTR